MSGWRTLGSSTGSGFSTTRLFEPTIAMMRSASARIVSSWGLPMFTGSTVSESISRSIPSIRSLT